MRLILICSMCLVLWACTTSPVGEPEEETSEVYPAPPHPPPPPPPPPPSEPVWPDEDMAGAPQDVIVTGSSRTYSDTRSPGLTQVKDFLPFIDVAMDPSAINDPTGYNPLEDYYTRLKIITLQSKATDMAGTRSGKYLKDKPDRDYRRESRGWLSRMMSSKSVNRTLLAEFDISKPDVTAAEALFSASFSSSRQEGESWSTDQNLALYATPWFKISSNTTVTARMKMQLSDQRESTGASARFLGTLTNAANLIAPTSSLITYFSAPAVNDASNFLDGAVSSLFGRAITEQSSGTMPIKTWSPDPFLVISAAMPDARDIRKTTKADKLGAWEVYLEEPIASMFTSQIQQGYGDLPLPDYEGVSEADILSFKIGNELTVYDYIFSRLDLADRIAMLNESGDAGLARTICNRIDRGLSEIGFNRWDSAAGVVAAARSDQMSQMASQAILQEEACPAMERLFDIY